MNVKQEKAIVLYISTNKNPEIKQLKYIDYAKESLLQSNNPFTRNPRLAEAPHPYNDWFRIFNREKGLYQSCIIRQNQAVIDIL